MNPNTFFSSFRVWTRFLITGIVFAVLIYTNQAAAQSVSAYGVKAGINQADFYNNQFDSQARTSFNAGFFLQVDFEKLPVSIQPELNYTRRGSDSGKVFGDLAFKGKYQTDYIEIPLMIKYSFPIPGNILTGVYSGPYAGYLLRSKFKFEYDSFNIKEETKSVDAGLAAGINFEFNTRFRPLILDLRYNHGLTEIFHPEMRFIIDEPPGSLYQSPEKHSFFSVSIGTRL